MEQALRAHVGADIGAIAKPKRVYIVDELPKTRSGKIVRRLLKDLAEDKGIGDASTLADQSVMEVIHRQVTGS
jgi:acetyl-CoA synthetase